MNPKLRAFLRPPPFKRWLKSVLKTLVFAYLGLAVFAWFAAGHILFHPPKVTYSDGPEHIHLTAADGNRITAVYLPNPQAAYVLLFSHGNAEDLADISLLLRELHDHGWAVFAYDYPGFGTSTGRPTEAGCDAAIDAAYDYLVNNLKIPPERIVLYGRSVGAGPSIDLASRRPVGGLVADSAFASAFRVCIPWKILPWDEFDNLAKIGRVKAPLLSIHALGDTVVPFWHGIALDDAHPGPKMHWWVEHADHNSIFDTDPEGYRAAIEKFRLSLPPGEPLTGAAK